MRRRRLATLETRLATSRAIRKAELAKSAQEDEDLRREIDHLQADLDAARRKIALLEGENEQIAIERRGRLTAENALDAARQRIEELEELMDGKPTLREWRMLGEENVELRAQIADLERRLDDLDAARKRIEELEARLAAVAYELDDCRQAAARQKQAREETENGRGALVYKPKSDV